MVAPRIAVAPTPRPGIAEAVQAGGGELVGPADAEGLVWLDGAQPEALAQLLTAHPGIRWVQLPAAGVERFAEAGVFDEAHEWTCAKGSYREAVAEHALALALAGLRLLPERARATSWGRQGGTSLFGQPVTLLGGGGISKALLALLAPFRVTATVVRRRPEPLPGAARTLGTERLTEALHGALVVFCNLALTPATTQIIGPAELEAMGPQCWLVNVGRGRLVDSEALVAALQAGTIRGAALDVTDPEPLPEGHPLWTAPNCLITPHTANTPEMLAPRLAERVEQNVRHFAAGQPLEGRVDPLAGY